MRKFIVGTGLALALALAADKAEAQAIQGGLINVAVPVNILNNAGINVNVPVNVQVPIGIAANVCGVNANVLAQQRAVGPVSCTATNNTQAFNNLLQRLNAQGGLIP
jgi:hypothetical protein